MSFLIDENGRVFGKINLIDFMVLLFGIALLPVFYYGYKIYGKVNHKIQPPPVQAQIEFQTDIYCHFIELDSELIKKIKIGDQDIGKEKNVHSTIVEIGKEIPHVEQIGIGGSQSLTLSSTNLKKLPVTLNASVYINGDRKVVYKAVPLAKDAIFEFTSKDYTAKCKVADKPIVEEVKSTDGSIGEGSKKEKSQKYQERTIHVRVAVTPEVAHIIKLGDADRSLEEKDYLAKISAILNREPEKSLIWNVEDKKYIYRNHPVNKEFILAIKLKGEQDKGKFFFKGAHVYIGGSIIFTTDLYSFTPTVIKFERSPS